MIKINRDESILYNNCNKAVIPQIFNIKPLMCTVWSININLDHPNYIFATHMFHTSKC